MSVVPPLPHCGERPATASARTSSRREHRNSLSTGERRIEVLLPNLRQSALVRPQYGGTCPTCSAWRYNSLRGPPMRMPQWRHRLLNRRIARRSPPKLPSMPAGKTRRKHNRGNSIWNRLFRHRFITDATGCWSHGGPREGLPRPLRECPRRWELGLRLFVTAPARTTARMRWNTCLFSADSPFATHTFFPQDATKKLVNCFFDEYWPHFPWTNNPRGVRGSLIFECYFAFVFLWALDPLACVCAYPP
ncbi:mucin TcMUCII [Trypanosoma cruzi]|nr:mucin TcMUCII [Trypanosoma cruzi]